MFGKRHMRAHQTNPSRGIFQRRLVRTARIQIGSRQLGDNWFHVDGVHRLLRNEIMGNMTAEDYYNQLDWLYGHNEAKLAA